MNQVASVTAPAHWLGREELYDPDHLVVMTIEWHEQAKWPADPDKTDIVGFAIARAKSKGFERFATATESIANIPAPWSVREIDASIVDAMDYRQRYRLIIAARRYNDRVMSVLVYVPDTIGREIAPLLSKIVASAGPL